MLFIEKTNRKPTATYRFVNTTMRAFLRIIAAVLCSFGLNIFLRALKYLSKLYVWNYYLILTYLSDLDSFA